MFVYFSNTLESEFNRLSLWYVVSFIFGIAFYFSLPFEPSIWVVTTAFIITLISLMLSSAMKKLLWQFLSWILCAYMFGIVISKYHVMITNTKTIETPVITNITGIIDSIRPTTKGISIIIKNVSSNDVTEIQKVRIHIPEKYTTGMSVGDFIKLRVKLQHPQTKVLPNSYDFGMFAYFAQIGATGYAMSQPDVIHTKTSKVSSIIFQIKNYIYSRLITIMGKENGNFAAAILLGETHGIDKAIMKNMRQAGISHILCVSGLHLSLVAMLLFVTCRFILNLSDYIACNFNIKRIASIGAFTGGYAYLLLTGAPVAATRAFIMTSIFIISVIMGRFVYPIRNIAIAGFVVLCVNPEYVLHPSFQLSFVAVISLVAGYEFYQKNKWILGENKGVLSSIRFYIASNVYSSFLASIITAPVVINQFYVFSTYSIFSNLIAVPIMSFFIMPLSILGVVLMPFGIDKVVLLMVKFFIEIIINLANYTNQLPGAVLYFGYITPLSIIIFLLGFFWLCLWQTRWRMYGIGIMFISCILMINAPKPDLIFDQTLKIVGIKNLQNKLEIYGDKIPEFNRTYWANWFGQKDADTYTITPNEFLMVNGHKIVLDYDTGAVYEYNGEKTTLIKDNQKSESAILVFCNKPACYVKFNNNRRF